MRALAPDVPLLVEIVLASEARTLQEREPPWLSAGERSVFDQIRHPKRRRDWLAGRLAAKRALGRLLGRELAEIEVLNGDAGQPYCRLPDGTLPAPAFSLSHCAAGAVCAAAPAGAVGVDWEPPFEAALALIELFAAPEERAALADAAAHARLWTLKEAVLKLLGLGARAGLHAVQSTPDGLRLFGAASARWRKLGQPPIAYRHEQREGATLALAWAR